jgi:hypothetical protein
MISCKGNGNAAYESNWNTAKEKSQASNPIPINCMLGHIQLLVSRRTTAIVEMHCSAIA